MNHYLHTVLPYVPPPQRVAWCYIDVLRIGARCFLVFTEARGYKGPSITNGIEYAIREYHRVADLYDWPEPSDLEYVEHYAGKPDEFDLVTLPGNGTGPEWKALRPDLCWELANALGELEERWQPTT